jgi:hypothetical protein
LPDMSSASSDSMEHGSDGKVRLRWMGSFSPRVESTAISCDRTGAANAITSATNRIAISTMPATDTTAPDSVCTIQVETLRSTSGQPAC